MLVYDYELNCPLYLRTGYNLSCEFSLVTNGENATILINYNSSRTEVIFNQDFNHTFVYLPKYSGIFNLSINMPNINLSLNKLINGNFSFFNI